MTAFLAPPAFGVSGTPGYASGRRYNMAQSGNASAVSANTLYVWMWRIDAPVTITSIGFVNNSAVVGVAKVALYTNPRAADTGTLLREGTTDVSTNVGLSGVSCPINSITLQPGWYAPAICFNAAANVVNASGGAGNPACGWLISALGGDASSPPIFSGAVTFSRALTYVTGPANFMPATLGALTFGGAPGSVILDFGVP